MAPGAWRHGGKPRIYLFGAKAKSCRGCMATGRKFRDVISQKQIGAPYLQKVMNLNRSVYLGKNLVFRRDVTAKP
jgi:hypothetical protein